MEKISGRIFVGGLCRETSEATLMEYFSNYGKIDDCFIVIDTTTGCSKGYGFVNFTDSAMADRALAQLDHYILGRKVDVKHATERGERNQGQEHDMLKKIFVGGLSHGLTVSQLRGYFERFGPVEDVVIMCDVKGIPRGFGFVTFNSVSDASTVLQRRFHVLDDKPVEVKKAEPVGVNRAELKDKTVSGQYEVCNTFTTVLPSSSSSFGPCFGVYPNPCGYAQAPLPPHGSTQAPPPFYVSAQAPLPPHGSTQPPPPFYGYAQAPLPPHGSAQAPSPFYVSAQPPQPFYVSAHKPHCLLTVLQKLHYLLTVLQKLHCLFTALHKLHRLFTALHKLHRLFMATHKLHCIPMAIRRRVIGFQAMAWPISPISVLTPYLQRLAIMILTEMTLSLFLIMKLPIFLPRLRRLVATQSRRQLWRQRM